MKTYKISQMTGRLYKELENQTLLHIEANDNNEEFQNYLLDRDTANIEIVPSTPEEINEVVIPEEVSNVQLRLALTKVGIFPSYIDNKIEKMPTSAEKERIITLWQHENTMRRKSKDINEMASNLGISQIQLDQLFILADTL